MTNDIPASAPSDALAAQVRRGRPSKVRTETHEPEREPKGRAERIPLGVQRLQLTADQRPGYVRRWVNDRADRIAQALQGGYEHVKDGKGENIWRYGSKSEKLTVYLMEIREDWYKADQATKMQSVTDTERQIKRGEVPGGSKPGQDGSYIPSRGIRFSKTA